MKNIFCFLMMACVMAGCMEKERVIYESFDAYPVRKGSLSEMEYTPSVTSFHLWSPNADEVRLMLYEEAEGGHAFQTHHMKLGDDGTWHVDVNEDLKGKFYAFNVKMQDEWLGDTPGLFAKAVGINGHRGAIIDMVQTNPTGWENDRKPALRSVADVVVYEMHHRDFSIDASSGIEHKGQFLALTEQGTQSPEGLTTGIDHLKELGVTHVHLLPSYDYASIDEHTFKDSHYNWGYDPQNYNVPDGSYATDPTQPVTRIMEFKQMVQALHQAGIRVVLDVVYNHTYNAATSAFEKTVPGYFYRMKPDGTFANGSGCGNETASNRPMMRKFMVESVLYWMREYHLDGFRFDLMGIHDIATMNEIRQEAQKLDPQVLIYGEGWAAETPQYAADSLAMKANIARMPGIAAFCDEMRDGLRGPWDDDKKGAFLAGLPGHEESIKFGIVGAISHPQVKMDEVNYSNKAWAQEPVQMMSYVSCHDDMCLVDRLRTSVTDLKGNDLEKLDMLAQTAVLTSQGIPFIFAGEEVMRDKKFVHNSFQSPDSVNAINWHNKAKYQWVFNYYKGLIAMRKHHPAFRLGSAELVRQHLEFLPVEGSGVVAFRLKDHAGGDAWDNIIVVLNARRETAKIEVPEGKYVAVVKDGWVNENGIGTIYGPILNIAPETALIVYQE
ncbi:MAG: type I pullulanase [Bacteroidaceae bacterium]|jgi:pullulanase|nr:type I pullulanase [Bacteroidaceae bacterium]